MAYRVRADDFIIEADSLEEFRSILAILGIISESKPQSRGAIWTEKLIGLPTAGKLKKFYDSVIATKGLMLKTIEALMPQPNGLNDLELREILRLQTNSALAGIMAGISKRAEKMGLTHQDIIIKEETDRTNGSKYRYRLTETMRDFMESKAPKPIPTPLVRQTDAESI